MLASGSSSRKLEVCLPFPPPLSLYIHMPWCLKKCPYCDFNSHEHAAMKVSDYVTESEVVMDVYEDYVDALIRDLEASLAAVWGRTVQSVFIGGGTPSLCPPKVLSRLLDAVRSRLRLSGDVEITLEANPGSFEQKRFESFALAGVNRLSLGVQSFSDQCLQTIGRAHDSSQAIRAVALSLEIFKRVNVDLMYGQPGQSLECYGRDLSILLDRIGPSPSHLSIYQFTLEPNTWFAKHPPHAMPDEDLIDAMQALTEDRLAKAGFQQYEVSAWAMAGERCRHNLNYWQFGDYLGIGAGSHGKLSDHRGIRRTQRRKNPQAYMNALARSGLNDFESERWLEPEALPFEFMLNVLRLKEGVPSHWWEERCGLPASVLIRKANPAFQQGFLDADPRVWRASDRGWRFLNDLQAVFLDDAPT